MSGEEEEAGLHDSTRVFDTMDDDPL